MSKTWVKYLFHGDKNPIEFTLPTYIIDMWIKEKKPIKTLRTLGTVLDFKELSQKKQYHKQRGLTPLPH